MHISPSELQQLTRAATLLVTPLDHETIDGWRAAVNRELRSLLRADSAGFLLPGVGGLLLFSEEHDPAELARYPDFHPPSLPDGKTIWERLLECRVSTMPTVYGSDVKLYLESAYYNEYAAPNGAGDTLCAMLPLGGADPRHVASVQLWRDRKNRRRFEERDRQLLTLLFPALTAGIESVVRWHKHRAELGQLFDTLGQAVRVCDERGLIVHETTALTVMLSTDPDVILLDEAIRRTAAAAIATVQRVNDGLPVGCAPVCEVRTPLARYRVRASVQHESRQRLTLVALERLTPVAPSPQALRESFGLTPAEARIALLLAEGRSNKEIADRLASSPSTVRRHTERVLQKLGVRTRAGVASRLALGE